MSILQQLVDPSAYAWSVYALLTLATALAMLAVGIGGLVVERGGREARLLFVLSFAISFWLATFSLMYLAQRSDVAFVWARAAYAGIAFIPAAVLHFAFGVVRRPSRWIGAAWTLAAAFAVAMVGSDALMRELYRYPWGFYPRFRWLGAPFLLFFFSCLALGWLALWRDWRSAREELHRRRSAWLLAGLSVAYLGSFDFVAAYGVELYPFGYVAVLVFVGTLAWTLRRFRLVDFTPELAARQILRTIPDPVLVCDREGVVRLANDAAARLLASAGRPLAGVAVAELADGDDARTKLERLRGGLEATAMPVRLRGARGAPLLAEVSSSLLTDAGGVAVGAVLTARDVTARALAERAALAADERYRAVAETALDAIVTADASGAIVYANPAAERLFGWEEPELLGQPLTMLMPERFHDSHRRGLSAHAASGQSRLLGRTLRAAGRRRDGSEFPLDLSLAAWSTGDGLFYTGLVRDTTEVLRAEEALRRSEETFRALADNLPAALFLAEGETLTYVNPTAALLMGASPEDLVGTKAWEIAQVASASTLRDLVAPPSGAPRAARLEVALATRSGERRWLDLSLAPLERAGRRSVLLSGYDITESKLMHGELRASERRFREILDGVRVIAVLRDLAGRVTYCNAFGLELLGYPMEELAGVDWFASCLPEERREVARARYALEIRSIAMPALEEGDIVTREGDRRLISWNNTLLRDAQGAVVGAAALGVDITERKRAEQRLLHEALHDALTGLPNRTLFMDRLGTALNRARRKRDYRMAVLFIDLDRFKLVNDSLGHLLGDRLLIDLGRRLERCLRPGDTVARLGGDEFTILLEELDDLGDARRVADRIAAELAAPFDLDGHEVFATASVGIALGADRYLRAEDMLRDADTALHRAKRGGKSGYQVFDTPMHRRAVAALQLENELRRALERDELCNLYQPIVELESGRLIGFEALLRWRHPRLGLLPPIEFIEIAEETGLIVELGRWVLREGCRQLRAWQAETVGAGDLVLTVNLSSRQFGYGGLAEDVAAALADSGLEAGRLKLEITESLIVEDPEAAAQMLGRLKTLGCHVCLDDFGTGYSSLSYLMRLPIDTLKVDRSFLTDLAQGSRNGDIVWAVIALAGRLGMEVIAEGIETEQQRRHLVELGCLLGQGFLFAKPLDPRRALLVVAAGRIESA